MNTTLAIAGAMLCALISSSVAWAGEAAPARTVAVETADLHLSTAAGQARLAQRVRAAVAEVCGDPSPLVQGGREAAIACRRATLAAVQQQLAPTRLAAAGEPRPSIPQ
jgi:UrcA family protein